MNTMQIPKPKNILHEDIILFLRVSTFVLSLQTYMDLVVKQKGNERKTLFFN